MFEGSPWNGKKEAGYGRHMRIKQTDIKIKTKNNKNTKATNITNQTSLKQATDNNDKQNNKP